jgi:hypothetical protein
MSFFGDSCSQLISVIVLSLSLSFSISLSLANVGEAQLVLKQNKNCEDASSKRMLGLLLFRTASEDKEFSRR